MFECLLVNVPGGIHSSLGRNSKLEMIGLVDTFIVFPGSKSFKRLCRMLSYTAQHQVRLGKGTDNSVNLGIWAGIGPVLPFPALGWVFP